MTSEPPLVPPPGDLPPGPVLVDRLDPELPLVLLPVRLATRFHRGDGPAAPPTELWVRIFPDALHADAHVAALSTEEVALGRAYWERLWRAAGRRRVRDDTHRWLVSQLGAPRAAWVARRTQPTNPEDAPDGPVPRGEPLVPAPAFGDLGDPPATRATLARGLPDRWLVRIVQGQDTITDVWSAPVRRPLAMAPNVADLPEGGGLRELLQAQDLWWMADFDEAVAAGMGVRLTLDSRQTVDELLVLGVRDRNPGAAAELAGLLDAHRFSTGLEIVPHGTPTNSTANRRRGLHRRTPRPRGLPGPPARRSCRRAPGAPGPGRAAHDERGRRPRPGARPRRRDGLRRRRARGRPDRGSRGGDEPGAVAGDLGPRAAHDGRIRRGAAARPRGLRLDARMVLRLGARRGPAPADPGGGPALRAAARHGPADQRGAARDPARRAADRPAHAARRLARLAPPRPRLLGAGPAALTGARGGGDRLGARCGPAPDRVPGPAGHRPLRGQRRPLRGGAHRARGALRRDDGHHPRGVRQPRAGDPRRHDR